MYKEDEIWTIINNLISSLSFLQNNGIFHGDIKPENIFVFPNNTYKIAEQRLFTHNNSFSFVFSMIEESPKNFSQIYFSPILLSVKLFILNYNFKAILIYNKFNVK